MSKCFPINKDKLSEVRYDDCKYEFMSVFPKNPTFFIIFLQDYDRCNPITQNKALNEWIKHFMMMQEKNEAAESKEGFLEILKRLDEDEKLNKLSFEGIRNYALFNQGLKQIQEYGYFQLNLKFHFQKEIKICYFL